jgi:hypothetical protein
VLEGVVADTVEAQRKGCFQAYQAHCFIIAQKQPMPLDWNPLDPLKSVKKRQTYGAIYYPAEDKKACAREHFDGVFLAIRLWRQEGNVPALDGTRLEIP